MADALAGWSDPVPAKSADPLAGWSAPVPAQPEATDAEALQAFRDKPGHPTIRGFLDMVPGSHKFIAAADSLISGEPYEKKLADTDALYDQERQDPRFRIGQAGGMLAMPGNGLKSMIALGAAQGAGDARGDFANTLEGAGMGGVLGGALHGAGALIGKIPAAAKGALPWLQQLEAKLTNQIGDRAVVQAEKTANSAAGSYRSSRADANRILELLQSRTGDAATDAASDALLNSPQGATLRREVVQGAQQRAPEALNQIDSLRALADQTRADIPISRAASTTDETLRDVLKQRTKDQLGRYVIPAIGGAVGGAIGGPVGFGIGAAAGRGVSPGVRAVVLNNVLAPERKLLATRAGLSVAQKIANLAQTNPAAAGKFAAPLTQAAARGADALAATHFTLSQDPAYQELMHANAEGDQ